MYLKKNLTSFIQPKIILGPTPAVVILNSLILFIAE